MVCKDRQLARWQRLQKHTPVTLFHQTSPENAEEIFEAGRMLRGKDECIAGSGIYFAGSPQDTDAKAHHKGAILACHVRLGNQKDITSCVQTGGPSATRVPHNFTDLSAEGYDSVTFKLTSGREWVVYNWDQATDFCIAKWVYLRAWHGRYLDCTTDGNGHVCTTEQPVRWLRVSNPDGTTSYCSEDGRFLSSHPDGHIWMAGWNQAWEFWTVAELEGPHEDYGAYTDPPAHSSFRTITLMSHHRGCKAHKYWWLCAWSDASTRLQHFVNAREEWVEYEC